MNKPDFGYSYTENKDALTFILNQLVGPVSNQVATTTTTPTAFAALPRIAKEKFGHKRTIKIKGLSSNHRGNDIIVREGMPIVRF